MNTGQPVITPLLLAIFEIMGGAANGDDVFERFLRAQHCDFCKYGISLENGMHHFQGIDIPCGYEERQREIEREKPREPFVLRGRGIVRRVKA